MSATKSAVAAKSAVDDYVGLVGELVRAISTDHVLTPRGEALRLEVIDRLTSLDEIASEFAMALGRAERRLRKLEKTSK